MCIVGAGYTGLWTAYYLRRLDPSLDVLVVEAETVGFGASGRNGGWCSALLPRASTRSPAGTAARRSLAMRRTMIDTVAEVGEVVAAEGSTATSPRGGTVVVARNPAQLVRAGAEVAHDLSWGGGGRA